MKVTTRDGSGERAVVTGMVVSRAVLGPIASRWDRGLFSSRWSSLVAGWAVEHFNKYGRAPGPMISTYLDAWAETAKDKETIGLVESFLVSLSDDWATLKKRMSSDHVLDLADGLFNRVRLTRLRDELEGAIESGDWDGAQKLTEAASRRIEIGTGAGIDLVSDVAEITNAFEQRGESLIEYPDALGNFFDGVLGRDQFVSFMAAEKVGKSFWLQDLAWRAFEQGRRVCYFEVGDMSQHQVIRRFASRASGRPRDAGRFVYPTSIDTNGPEAAPEMGTEIRDEPAMTVGDALDAFAEAKRRYGADRFELSCHPNSSISVHGIDAVLDGWERNGDAPPDVIVVDYADILAPLDGRAETRDQINASWKALRALSQKRHCLVVTATQTNAQSYKAGTLDRTHFSEDKRKYAHVTAMVGINRHLDGDKHLYRLNMVLARELAFSESKVVWCASCLPIGQVAVHSVF